MKKLCKRMDGWKGKGSALFVLSLALASTILLVAPVAWAQLYTLTKTDSPDPVEPGATITYTITITTDFSVPPPLEVRDDIPLNTTYVSATPAPTSAPPSGGTGTVTWTLTPADLNFAQPWTGYLTVRVDSPLAGGTIISNRAELWDIWEVPTLVAWDEATTEVLSAPVWVFTKTDTPDPVQVGEDITYTITYTNSGNTDARGTTITDVTPANTTYVSATPTPVSRPPVGGSGTVSWDVGTAAGGGGTGSVTLRVKVNSSLADGTLITNTANISCRENVRDSAAQSTTVSAPAWVLAIQDTPDPVQNGANVTYTISCTNTGSGYACNVVLTAVPPEHTSYVSSSAGGTYDSTTNTVTWRLGTVAGKGSSRSVELVLRVHIRPGEVADRVTLEAGIGCAEAIEATATEETTVTAAPVLEINMAADKTTADVCEEITYTIIYSNTGNARANEVVVDTDIPERTNFVTGSATCCATLQVDRLVWRIDHLDPEATEQKKFKVRVEGVMPPGTTQLVTRASIVSAELAEPVESDPVVVLVTMPYLRLIKIADRAKAELGDVVTYIISIKNISWEDTALDATITDILPMGFSYVTGTTLVNGSQAADPETIDPNTYQWSLPPIDGQSVTTLSYQAKITLAAKIGINANHATVTAISPFGIEIQAGPVKAVINIVRGIFSDLGRIIGKVFHDKNGNRTQGIGEPGISGVALILENGTIVVTDSHGKYIMPNLVPGDHLLSIDETTLPPGYFLASRTSKFVYVPTAGTAKVNFWVRK